MTDDDAFSKPEGNFSMRVGHEQIDIEQRWEVVSILNDVLTGLWFLTGSILNIAGDFGNWPLYLYLAGSSQLLLRAFLRLGRRVHIRGGYERSRPRTYKPDADEPS